MRSRLPSLAKAQPRSSLSKTSGAYSLRRFGGPVAALGFTFFGALAASFSGSLACAGLLGVSDDLTIGAASATAPGDPPDATLSPMDGTMPTTETGVPPKPGASECDIDADCRPLLPETEPAKCAVAICRDNRCQFRAKDEDGDGFTVACTTKSGREILKSAKLDCDDKQPGVVPGTEVDCSDGSFSLPAKGECRAGKKKCQDDGTFSACVGLVVPTADGPGPPDRCDLRDNDCNGTVDDNCPCSAGATADCGPSEAGRGICKNGKKTCTPASVWGACMNAVFPSARDCTSSLDNDCNGVIDKDEDGCKCDGKLSGATRACDTANPGPCAAGTQTCVVATTGATWSRCIGPTPGALDCTSAIDNNCNGKVDNQEASCKCDNVTPPGTMRNCTACGGGTQTCNLAPSGATWGTCSGGVPGTRNCRSGADNDCNGEADNQESTCKCDGIYALDTVRGCVRGGCAGERTCILNAVTGNATWTACMADCGGGGGPIP
jgi:Putative metal-binding motif